MEDSPYILESMSYLELYGDKTVTIYRGDNFVEPGYIAIDKDGTDLTHTVNVDLGGLNINVAGEYTVTYSFTDSSGKLITKTRTVVVGARLPIISETGKNKEPFVNQIANNTPAKEAYLLALVKAYSPDYGDISSSITITNDGGFDPSLVGDYRIIYQVIDIDSNVATYELTVTVWDFVKMESGSYHTLAMTSHGKLWAWGYNAEGQIGKGSTRKCNHPSTNKFSR